MSYFDYHEYRELPHASFAALIMAAYQRADSYNAATLAAGFPEIIAEFRARYDAPGGILPGERVSS